MAGWSQCGCQKEISHSFDVSLSNADEIDFIMFCLDMLKRVSTAQIATNLF